MKSRTIVFTAPGKVVIEERDRPEPGPDDLLIKTRCSLISTGTELSILSGESEPGTVWATIARFPYIPGYDNIGEVVEVGGNVDKSLIGKKVATYGKHAQYVTVRAENARTIHRDIPDEHAVFFTIAEIVMNSIRRGSVGWGESVVVCGLGLLGQLAVRFCRLCGARPVIAVDVADSRLACLPQDKAIVPLNPARDDVQSVIAEATKGRKADVVFEVTGSREAIPGQVRMLRDLGRLVMLGCPRGTTEFDFHDLCNWPSISIIGAHNMSHPRQATLQNPWTNQRHAEMFFDLVADGEVSVEPLISHRVNWSEAPSIYEMLVSDRSQAMGVVFDWKD